MTTRLALERLGVRAGRRWLVRDVTVEIPAGEILGVIGPNGAGKTTLLEAVVGLRPAEGTVRVDGVALRSFRDAARVFAFMPDAMTLAPEATVRTLVGGGADDEGLRRALKIDALLDAPAGILSRGERQRVALYGTLVLGRSIVVLDEPLAPFDPVQLREVVAAIRRAGATVIASVHQLGDAERLADRFLLLAEGRALACGDLPELRARAELAGDASLEDVLVALLSEGSGAPAQP